jgi:histidyl-tRNA synthetase
LKYADRRGFRIALIAGGDEFGRGVCQVKNLQTGEKQDVPLAADAASVVAAVREILGNSGQSAVGSRQL